MLMWAGEIKVIHIYDPLLSHRVKVGVVHVSLLLSLWLHMYKFINH